MGENVNPRLFSGTSGSLIGLCIINECFCSMAFFFLACQVSRLVQEADRLTPTHADPLSVAAEDRLDDDDTTNSRRTVHRTSQVSIFVFFFYFWQTENQCDVWPSQQPACCPSEIVWRFSGVWQHFFLYQSIASEKLYNSSFRSVAIGPCVGPQIHGNEGWVGSAN